MQGNQSEIMWPSLIANKILRKRLGSNNFVADFPNTTERSFDILRSHDESSSLKSLFKDPKDTKKYKVFVSTWNVGGVAPPDDLNMEDLLDKHNNLCDIYVLGFQEIVPLSTQTILGVEKSRISTKWNSLIRTALNKTIPISDTNQETKKLEESQRICPIKNGNLMEREIQRDFHCIISKHMVGILISVWVRSDFLKYIQHPSVSCVGCGIMGCLGNKGSVSIRFCLHETSFCFVCCHLASGGKEGDERHRNSDAKEILSRTSFPHGSSLKLPQKILDHDRIIFFGDLNYRISMPEAMTRSFVDKREWDILLDNDQILMRHSGRKNKGFFVIKKEHQGTKVIDKRLETKLRVELMEGQVFEGWKEGIIEFEPTYKYYRNSDVYYGYVPNKKGEKRRAPAWCDRIIWFGKGFKQKQYSRGESRLSDHRPVRSIFTAEVEILRTSNGFKSIFLSNRFD